MSAALHTLDGRYRLEHEIGRGGMGVVWRATQLALERPVAIKLLAPSLAHDAASLTRFRREALAASRLAHPGIVTVLDAGIADGAPYLVMELVEGQGLDARIAMRGRLEPSEALAVARQIADALGAAHGAGIVHRDVKPANVILGTDGRARLLDFGLATLARDGARGATRAGMVLGTPDYMPPELARAEQVDARADVYALGATLYEMLTGAPPYPRADPVAAMLAHLTEPLLPASSHVPGIAPALDALVARMLEKDRALRPVDGRALVPHIDALIPAPPRGEPTFTVLALARHGAEPLLPAEVEVARAPSGERVVIASRSEEALAVVARLGPGVACGVHRGALDRIGDVALGEAVRGAIRLARLAVRGQALVSSEVHDDVGLGWMARMRRGGTRVALGHRTSDVFVLGEGEPATRVGSEAVPGGRVFRCECGARGNVRTTMAHDATLRVRCASCSGLCELAPAEALAAREGRPTESELPSPLEAPEGSSAPARAARSSDAPTSELPVSQALALPRPEAERALDDGILSLMADDG